MPSTRTRARVGLVEGADEADDGRLARSRRADERGHRSGARFEGNAVQHGLVRLVGELDIVEGDVAVNLAESVGARGIGEFVTLARGSPWCGRGRRRLR